MDKVVIAGGTGFIGSYLKKRFQENGYLVFIISRSKSENNIPWNESEISQILENSKLVINLAGKSINCRHTKKNKLLLYNSRIESTKIIGSAIKNCTNPPKIWINASAAGIYKSTTSVPHTEYSDDFGTDFLAKLVKDWENAFYSFNFTSTRQIALRTSVVLEKNAGALLPLIKLTRLGLGGKQANGEQIFSWIHIEDYFRIIIFIIHNNSITGAINCTSPTPITNKKLMDQLRATYKINLGIPAPTFAIKIGAFLIGTEPSLILNNSNIHPKRLTECNFQFKYPNIETVFEELVN